MPNMSRRAIHSYEMSEKSTNTDSATYTSLKPTRLFSSTQANNNYYKTTQKRSIFRRIVTSVLTIVTMFFLSITSTISYGYWGFHHVAVWLAKKVHHLTSKVMLLDTWLLRSNSYGGNKTRRVLLLCLLPLLLIGGWWFLSSLGPYLSESLNQKTAPFQTKTNSEELYQFVQKDAPSIGSTLTQEQLEKIAILVKNLNSNEENEQNRNVLLNYQSKTDQNMADISTKIKTQEDLIHNLKNELYTVKTNAENQTNPENEERILNIEHAIENHQKLLLELKTCCNKESEIIPINIDEKIQTSINQFFENQKEQDTSSLEAKITTLKNDLDQKLDVLKTNFDAILKNKEHELIETIAVKIKSELSSLNIQDSSNTISDIKIMSIVQNALKIYDADRTGLVDYAMEPMGGQILTTRCTESYNSRSAVVSIFGLPLYYTTKSPRVVITPNLMVPGECWAFQNFPGLLVIKLPGPVLVESFSLEHISKLLVSNGNIDSAPKDFSVFGLESENDKMGILIGDYVYDYNGDSLQFFHAQNPGLVFEYIEIRITSNHGNPNYTCLYRFRVHGKMQK